MFNQSQINVELGTQPLPEGFVSVPVITFVDATLEDDLDYEGCTSAEASSKEWAQNNVDYHNFWWVRNFIKQQVYLYTDAYAARVFEGLPTPNPFAWDYGIFGLFNNQIAKIAYLVPLQINYNDIYNEMLHMFTQRITGKFTKEARALVFSRVLRQPRALLQQRVDEISGRTQTSSDLRYLIYSAHDNQIANIVEFLEPTNITQDHVVFAAQVTIELHYSCTESDACFTVQTLWNGLPMGFKECASLEDPDGTVCSLDAFSQHLDSIWYGGDLDEGCRHE